MTLLKNKYTYLFLGIILLNIFDIMSTNIILQNGGRELNYIVFQFMKWFGVLPGMLILKFTVLLFCSYLFFCYIKRKFNNNREYKLFEYSIVIVFIAYSALFIHQWRMLLLI